MDKSTLLKRKEYCLKHSLCFVCLGPLNETSRSVEHSDVGMVTVNSKFIK